VKIFLHCCSIGPVEYFSQIAPKCPQCSPHQQPAGMFKKVVQQGHSHFDARSVHLVREHGTMARTPLAAFFNIPQLFSGRHAMNEVTCLNLETAVGSQKSTQALGAPRKIKKCLITNKVTTNFLISRCTPISYASFLRPTAVSRLKRVVTGVARCSLLILICTLGGALDAPKGLAGTEPVQMGSNGSRYPIHGTNFI